MTIVFHKKVGNNLIWRKNRELCELWPDPETVLTEACFVKSGKSR
jgi:hypothetical protein